jgi:hypothetical protein
VLTDGDALLALNLPKLTPSERGEKLALGLGFGEAC